MKPTNVLLTHASLIDGTGAPPLHNSYILIKDGIIQKIGLSNSFNPPDDVSIIDLTGKYIVPGVINCHCHIDADPESKLNQYALYGVTTVASLGNDSDAVLRIRNEQRGGKIRGARVFFSRYRFGLPPDPKIVTPEQARLKVDEIVSEGADIIKIWIDSLYGKRPKLTRDFCAAVLSQARAHSKVSFAHIYEHCDAEFAVQEGVNVLAHNVRDKALDSALIAQLLDHQVSVIPTLARDEGMFAYSQDPCWVDDPFFLKGISMERLAILKSQKKTEQSKDPDLPLIRLGFEMNKANLKRLSDAGVRIGFGTDSGGNPDRFFVQGFFEHREMELMQAAGMTPSQIIQSFSKHASEILGMDRHLGTIEPGKCADLLVLQDNPLINIRNMRSISTVYINGQMFVPNPKPDIRMNKLSEERLGNAS